MQVKVKTMVGRVYEFDVKPEEKVFGLMQRVSENVGIPPDQ
jgi:hypothetical protein